MPVPGPRALLPRRRPRATNPAAPLLGLPLASQVCPADPEAARRVPCAKGSDQHRRGARPAKERWATTADAKPVHTPSTPGMRRLPADVRPPRHRAFISRSACPAPPPPPPYPRPSQALKSTCSRRLRCARRRFTPTSALSCEIRSHLLRVTTRSAHTTTRTRGHPDQRRGE